HCGTDAALLITIRRRDDELGSARRLARRAHGLAVRIVVGAVVWWLRGAQSRARTAIGRQWRVVGPAAGWVHVTPRQAGWARLGEGSIRDVASLCGAHRNHHGAVHSV